MPGPIAALAAAFLLAHLLYLPPTLEDIDAINFALAVREFDVARHQPHPPGYPVFVVLAKGATALLEALGVRGAAPRALAALSAVSGALLVPILFALFRRLAGDARTAWWGMAIAICSPLLWFTASRPLSDATGLAFAAAAQLLIVRAMPAGHPGAVDARPPSARSLAAGAALCGIAAGVRAQTAMLTVPLLAAALLWPGGLPVRARTGAVLAAIGGALLWGVPLLAASGGPEGYLAALRSQAGEDFSGVVMLWTRREPRVAVDALLHTFVWPWGLFPLGVAVLALAALGLARVAWRAPRALVLLAVAFGPYAVFHLLFHETVTVRYALPLVLPIALLAAEAGRALGSAGPRVVGVPIVAVSLILTVPALRAYGRTAAPAFAAFDAAVHRAEREGAVVAMHAGMRRVAEWHAGTHGVPVLEGPHGREWLALVDWWREHPDDTAYFLADPRRTDLALVDPRARTPVLATRWSHREMPFVAGTRPGATDLHRLRAPGWMLGGGWAVTPEVAGVTARAGAGPHVEPAQAWVRARPEPARLLLGGRNLSDDRPGRLTVSIAGQIAGSWEIAPGPFLHTLPIPGEVLHGSGYVPLQVKAEREGGGDPPRVSLEQFDLQPLATPMAGFAAGWHEPEYNPATGRSWRWMSEDAVLLVPPVGRDVRLTLRGESPLRYFEAAPEVRVTAGGRELARFAPGGDWEQTVRLPDDLLRASAGQVRIESSRWFSPAEREGSPDRRHLALRVYAAGVD